MRQKAKFAKRASVAATVPRTAAALIAAAVITLGYGCSRSKPNFTGVWRLDTTNSTFQGAINVSHTLTEDIRHNDPFLHVTATVSGTTSEFNFLSNGRETVDTKMDTHITAKWEGDTLALTFVSHGKISRARWTLSSDGNTLTQQISDDTSVQRFVFLRL